MLASTGFLVAALVCGAAAAAVIGLVREIRGVLAHQVGSGRAGRVWAALSSPRTGGRIAAAVLAGVVVLVATRWVVAAAGVLVLIALWPKLFGGKRAEERETAYLEAVVTFTETLRDTVQAGDTLEQALPAAARDAPTILAPALTRLVGQIRARVPLADALHRLAVELGGAAEFVIGALMLSVARRGDRLADALTGLAGSAREQLDARRRITAGREETRRGVHIVVAVTVVMVVGLTLVGRSYVAVYDTPAGQVVLAVVAGIFAAGFAWLRRLSTPPKPVPILARPDRRLTGAEQAILAAVTAETSDAVPVTVETSAAAPYPTGAAVDAGVRR